MANEETQAPQDNETQNPPGYVGDLDPKARGQFMMLQQQSNQITGQIGQMEVKKAQLLRNMDQLQAEAQKIIDAEADRLGIPQGVPWQITPDGKAIRMPDPQQPQAPAQLAPVPDPDEEVPAEEEAEAPEEESADETAPEAETPAEEESAPQVEE